MKGKKWILFAMIILGAKVHAMDFLPFGGSYQEQDIEEPTRCYESGISQDQRDDLRYALTALAYNSFSAILADRIQLQEAMLHVDLVHPLHFISAVFLDQELIDCMHIIKEKQWLWRHFFNRVKRTLDEEVKKDNLRPEYVQEFSAILNLDCGPILQLVMDANWDGLVETLFAKFPPIKKE